MDELSLISYIEENSREKLKFNGSMIIKSIGDDTAIFRDKNNILITSDTLTENTHFRTDYYSFSQIGAKALLANISDIASMGGTPRFFILSLLVPDYLTEAHIKETIDGIIEMAKNDRISLIGGNISKAREFSISITLLGDYTAKQTAISRYSAEYDDLIFVSGYIGNAWLSYYIMENSERIKEHIEKFIMNTDDIDTDNNNIFINAMTDSENSYKIYKADNKSKTSKNILMQFIKNYAKKNLIHPSRVKLGKILAANKIANSMTDISDGLYKDINNLLSSKDKNSCALIIADDIPLSDEFKNIAKILNLKDTDILNNIISFGEDYELLWSTSRADENKLLEIAKKERIKISKIGSIVKCNTDDRQSTQGTEDIGYNDDAAGYTEADFRADKKVRVNFIYKNKSLAITPMTFEHISNNL
ncbi:MAG: thiamine-monophosphate kinase [Candidatus Acididesulfobacter guangdongensis]|uniref:Thiamine-monophosphate kinase n=1 Tax=Acididesulfobacter guangdongensis TaxID=2597225 RepID=A0A519BGQ6_ACIG2|nr:MAG: thiamine-monophosphate kinase [Candidatus Acididesulfobacter guangdongensis]